jgi:hypothetical protein
VLQGVKETGTGDCEDRQIFITIFAKEDMKDTTAIFEFASWQFDEPSQGGVVRGTGDIKDPTKADIDWGSIVAAKSLRVAFAGLLGVISIV